MANGFKAISKAAIQAKHAKKEAAKAAAKGNLNGAVKMKDLLELVEGE